MLIYAFIYEEKEKSWISPRERGGGEVARVEEEGGTVYSKRWYENKKNKLFVARLFGK